MANGPTQSGRFSDPGLTDVQWQLLDSQGNPLTPLAAPDRNGGGGNYLVTPVYPPGYQYGFIRWVSASAGLDYEDVCNLDAPVPYPPAPPATPAPGSIAYPTDALGRLTLDATIIPGCSDALTLYDSLGTVVYQGAGKGVSTTINLPLDPGALPGGPDSPGQVVAWTWDLSGVPAGLYTGSAAATGAAALAVTVRTGTYPPFPAHLLPVARWRQTLRRAVFDAPIDPEDPSTVVIPNAALDDALGEALSALTLWSPETRALPPLTLTAGQSVYPLPADFADPVEETWGALLGPDPLASGRLPGARYALLRRQGMLDAPPAGSLRGNGSYAPGYWGGGAFGGGTPILPEDGAGNALAGPYQRPRAELFPADFDHPAPYLLLTPAPSATGRPLTTLRYKAAWLTRRLTLGTDGGWATDGSGAILYAPAPLSADFDDDTDVLPFTAGDDLVRQSLRYATYWVLSQRILSLADTDAEQFAFYQVRSGLGRKDIQQVADNAKAEFDERNRRRPRGTRG